MSGPPPIRAERLCKRFRKGILSGAWIEPVSDVSFEVAAGEVLGLVGRNGSGKTTTIGLVTGLLRPTRGTSLLLGREPSSREVRRRLGFLPESGGLEPLATPREALRLRASAQGVRAVAAAADAALERFGLADVATREIRRLSQGQARRTALAQAFLGEPEILFLDEPSSGLDPEGSALLVDLVAEARARGASVVLASHVVAAGADICDRLIVLHAGRVAASGTRAELLDEADVVEARIRGIAAADLAAVVARAGGALVEARPARRGLDALLSRALSDGSQGE